MIWSLLGEGQSVGILSNERYQEALPQLSIVSYHDEGMLKIFNFLFIFKLIISYEAGLQTPLLNTPYT